MAYEPAESASPIYGGNSNWRGPVWFPMNFLMVEALNAYHMYYDETLLVEIPTGSGKLGTLPMPRARSPNASRRFFCETRKPAERAVFGANEYFQTDPHWRDYPPFHEYFHGDNGAGLGASHQTGWTALVAELIRQSRLDASAMDLGPMADNPPMLRESPVEHSSSGHLDD